MGCYQRVRILHTLSGYWVIFLQKRKLWVLLNVFDCRTFIAAKRLVIGITFRTTPVIHPSCIATMCNYYVYLWLPYISNINEKIKNNNNNNDNDNNNNNKNTFINEGTYSVHNVSCLVITVDLLHR